LGNGLLGILSFKKPRTKVVKKILYLHNTHKQNPPPKQNWFLSEHYKFLVQRLHWCLQVQILHFPSETWFNLRSHSMPWVNRNVEITFHPHSCNCKWFTLYFCANPCQTIQERKFILSRFRVINWSLPN
jgi:hypothetical protein